MGKHSVGLFISVASLLVFAFSPEPLRRTPARCSRADVGTAVANATYGDTLQLPSSFAKRFFDCSSDQS